MIDEQKKVIKQAKLPCDENAVEGFFGYIPKESLSAVIEACGIWYGLYDYLVGRCNVVKVANPGQTKLNENGRKTDKWDSRRLAEKLRADEICEAYVPQKEARDYRSKVRHRQAMVSVDSAIKNMIHAILRRENIKHPKEFDDIFTKKGVRWLKSLNITEIQSCLELITAADVQVKKAADSIPDKFCKTEIELLKTMPGVGDITAPVIMSEIIDIKRFENPRALCKYAGLVPKVIQSGDSDRRGKLVKQSSARLRTAIIQCAHGVLKTKKMTKLKMFYFKMSKRKKSNTAIAALAHKMLYIMWFMLTNNEEFHDGGTPVSE